MTLQIYVLRLVAVRILVAALILLGVLQVLDLLEVTTEILDRGLGAGGVAYYAALRLPRLIEQVAPLSVLAGGLLAFAQLASDNAVTVMRAVGLSTYRLAAMAAPAALAVAVIDFTVVEWVAPRTDPVLESWWRETTPPAKQVDIPAKPFRVGRDVVVAKPGDDKGRVLEAVKIYRRDPAGRLVERIEAPRAEFGPQGWRLINPQIVRFTALDSMSSTAAKMDWPLKLQPEDVRMLLSANPDQTAASSQRALRGGASERPDSYYAVRFQRAFATPAGVLIMFLLTIPVALGNFRKRDGAVFTAVGLGAGLGYLVVDGLLSALGENAALSAGLAAWTAPMVFAALAAAALLKLEG